MPSTVIAKAVDKGLIEPEDLYSLLHLDIAGSIKIFDASAVLPGSDIIPKDEYEAEHIKGAKFFDIDEISDKRSSLPHMLPLEKDFEASMRAMGINQSDFVVIYGQTGIVMGPARVWWMFRAFGHDNVCVLNGGLPAWEAAGYETTNIPTPPCEPSNFTAKIQRHLMRNAHDIEAAIQNQSAIILDARPPGRFNGEDDEPRAGLAKGHIPGSKNIPASKLVEPASGKIKTSKKLQAIFGPIEIAQETEIITTCGSGVTACVIALALYKRGIKTASVYDGSWAEWGDPKVKKQIEQ